MISSFFHRRLRRRAEHLAGRLAGHLPVGASVLDVGSGTGHNAEAIRNRLGMRCVEADVVDFHVVGPGPVVIGGTTLPFGEGEFDACVIAFVLSFVDDPVAMLREASRVAGGRVLLLQSTCRGGWSRACLWVRGRIQGPMAFEACRRLGLIPPVRSPMNRPRRLNRDELRQIIARAGLVVEAVEPERGFASISRDLFVLSNGARPPSPTVSVIIPARNEEAMIAATVASVIAARKVHPEPDRVEILVVDNASTDRTVEVVAGIEDVRVVTCETLGAARARNLGASLATGSVMIFLDADTRMPPGAIRRVAELRVEHGYEAGICKLGAADGGRLARAWWWFWNLVRRLPIARAKAMPAFMFCTREAFHEFGPFDEAVAIGEEWPILAGLYRDRPDRLIYDQATTALSSSRRMDLQRFGYWRTFAKYAWAILSHRGRVGYPDHIRHAPEVEVHQ